MVYWLKSPPRVACVGRVLAVFERLILGIPFVVDHEEEAVLAVEDVGNRDRSGEHESVVVIFIGERGGERSGIVVVIPESIRVVVAKEVERRCRDN